MIRLAGSCPLGGRPTHRSARPPPCAQIATSRARAQSKFAALGLGQGVAMKRWRSVVVGAVTCGGLVLTGCGSVQSGSGSGSRAPSGSPAGSSPPAEAAAPTSGTGAGTADIGLSSPHAPFTGDVVTLTVQAWQAPHDTQPVRVASATVDLGDGTTATVRGPCSGATLPAPGDGLVVRHVYQIGRAHV